MKTLYETGTTNPAGYRDVLPALVAAMRHDVHIVDVREPDETNLGHIPGAELVPLATVESAAKRWRTQDDIVVVCRSGGRSGRAAAALAAMGFSRVMNMAGGMLAWTEARLPLERAQQMRGHAIDA